MHFNVIAILLELSIIVFVNCYSFNANDVILISEDSVKNTYFAYSLLLQSGETKSSLIIGAPKNNIKPQLGGDIYKCEIGIDGRTSCVQYPAGRSINSNSTGGNFFGISLDGEDHVNGALVACAPRTVTSKNANYLRGYCIYMKNTSQVTDPPVEITPLNDNNGLYHDSSCCDANWRAYYDFAFAMAGFDVAFYSEEKREVLLGAPGVKKFNGATISYSIDDQGVSLLPNRKKPVLIDEDTYFGYSVTTAKFKRNSDETWFIAGAPRSNDLKGKVTIYNYDVTATDKTNIAATFYGEEVGSYFGASVLALDVTNDSTIDLLVGAPMASGKTWDEGSVSFYRNLNGNLDQQKITLTGSRQNGSRFGSAIVSLGDFDLDGFNDVAISAPYEDNGRGAVYIYRGSSEGLTDQASQRLSPIDFNVHGTGAQGFGMGLSRGNDIDGNGHNDIAIGAYKSDQVFIVKSYSIIDYQFLLTSSIDAITNNTSFDLRFCLSYTKRSRKNILSEVTFNFTIDLDYRSLEDNISDYIIVPLEKYTCKNYLVQIMSTITDLLPFQINLQISKGTADIIAHGETSSELKIPYSHGCGSDNMCVTDLSVELETKSQELVLGLNKQLDLTVKVNNSGEPAYQCKVNIEVPEGIDLRNQKDCTRTNGKYICLIDERLTDYNQREYIFDVKDIKPHIPAVEIAVEVTSLFKNKGDRNKARLTISLILDSTPNLIGKSVPENLELEIKSNISDLEVVHQFFLRKTGPSPLKVDVDILLPVLEYNQQNVLNILEVKGHIDSIEISCTPTPIRLENNLDIMELTDLTVPLNRTVLLSCTNEEGCQRYKCQGEYLYNSGQVAMFEVRMLITSELLVAKYKTDLVTKDLIALVPVIFQNGPSERVEASSILLIFVHGINFVPLWVYLVAPAIGVILLLLVSYGLYRCNFFDRVYKDKLDQEKILGSNDGSVEEEIFDNIIFKPMEETKHNEYL